MARQIRISGHPNSRLIRQINRFASLQRTTPTNAVRTFLEDNLSKAIKTAEENQVKKTPQLAV